MIRAIVGTAGHIDHGKSALVKALTGIETDRLPEEKERGISIELGFAHLDLDAIGRIGVIDVPGHERFIRQMLAGAHGFDLVVVVVAADDGVMPQTEEHFEIVHLLGLDKAIFVVTKCDVASADRIAEVREEIAILAAGTRLEGAPVVEVCARSGAGIEALRDLIAGSLKSLVPKKSDEAFRLAVDRVFVMKGHGVVVTGTAIGGSIRAGSEVCILPSARRARLREIQVHGSAAEEAAAGERVALNLAGIARDEIERGDTITTDAALEPTSRIDARIEIRPLARRTVSSHCRVRVHHCASQSTARLVWLDGIDEVAPRSSAFAQLVLAEPLVAQAGDRFVIRDETAEHTLGGGVVLVAHAARHRRADGDVGPHLHVIESGDAAARLRTTLAMTDAVGLAPEQASRAIRTSAQQAVALAAAGDGITVLPGLAAPEMLVTSAKLAAALERITTSVRAWESAHPELSGIDLEQLRTSAKPPLDAKTFRLLVDRLEGGGTLVRRGNVVHTSGHAASLGGGDEGLALRVLERIDEAGSMPPMVKELADEMSAPPERIAKVAAVLLLQGRLVKVAPELFFAPQRLDEIAAKLKDYLERESEITAAAFRDLIAASRKYGIPLLDWFDRSGLTIRVGDVRRLRRSAARN
ncbi:MAG TPA: selenocysteine-specific translation elongation factor [Candidatus Binatia bacterium]|jgi:selenocysteine-specific elongation factor